MERPQHSIVRDRHGFPTVRSRSAAGAAYGVGRAQCQDDPAGLLLVLARAAGREARALGLCPGSDPRRPLSDPRVRGDRTTHLFGLPERARRLHRNLAPATRLLVDAYVAGVEEERARLAPAQVPPGLRSFRVRPWHVLALDLRVAAWTELHATGAFAASNAVAVAGRRSTTGAALLLADPHLPLCALPELFAWAFHVRAPGFRGSGMGRLGSPFLAIGTNGRVAWTFAANWPITAAVIEVPARSARVRTAEVRIPVRGRPAVTVRVACVGDRSRPVLWRRGARLRVALLATAHAGDLSTWFHALLRARTAAGLIRTALERMVLGGQSIVAADMSGAIAATWAARPLGEPRARPAGEANRIDDGGRDGLLVNCNATPSLWRPDAPHRERPAPFFSDPRPLSSYRHARARQLLAGRHRIGAVHLRALAGDTTNALAGPLFALLPAVARRFRGWDRRDLPGSRLATLFHLFVDALLVVEPRAAAWIERPELLPPAADRTLSRRAARALGRAEERFKRFGRPPWGAVHRIRVGGRDLPLAGSAATLAAPAPLEPRRPLSPFRRVTPALDATVGHGAALTLLMTLGPYPRVLLKKPVDDRGRPGELLDRFAAGEFVPFEPQ